jgi:hypothetical protein
MYASHEQVCVYAGNPADSLDVHTYVDGYANRVLAKGYRPQSAVPWTAEDVPRVVQHMAQLACTEHGFSKVLVARDLFCLTILWNSVSRGLTAVQWCLSDISLKDGTYGHKRIQANLSRVFCRDISCT